MIQISSLVWSTAIFFLVMGFLRGWNKELASLAGIAFGVFVLFQLDPLLRSSIFSILSLNQIFIIQTGIFVAFVFLIYRSFDWGSERQAGNWGASIIGGLIGFANGYLVSTTIWYFLDVNEYPFEPFIVAPGPTSASSGMINLIPIVSIGNNLGSGSDVLVLVIVALLFLVLVAQ